MKESATKIPRVVDTHPGEPTDQGRSVSTKAQGHSVWQNEITGRAIHLGDVYMYNNSDADRHQPDNPVWAAHPRTQPDKTQIANRIYRVERTSSPHFTGCRLQSEMLCNMLKSSTIVDVPQKHRVVVVWGLGGSGKTQFCLRFAEEHRSR